MTDPRIIDLLRARVRGESLWLPVAGHSLWPLVKPEDHLEVQRCEPDELERGDVAVVLLGGQLIAHIVVSLQPVRTASIVGVTDPVGEPLGRAVTLRRGGRTVPIPRIANQFVRWLPPAALVARDFVLLRAVVRRLRGPPR